MVVLVADAATGLRWSVDELAAPRCFCCVGVVAVLKRTAGRELISFWHKRFYFSRMNSHRFLPLIIFSQKPKEGKQATHNRIKWVVIDVSSRPPLVWLSPFLDSDD